MNHKILVQKKEGKKLQDNMKQNAILFNIWTKTSTETEIIFMDFHVSSLEKINNNFNKVVRKFFEGEIS